MSRKRKRKNSLTSDIGGFVAGGVGLGIGAGIAAKAQVGSGVNVTQGFSAAGGMMPIVGTTMMGGHALRGLQNLQPKKRKKRK